VPRRQEADPKSKEIIEQPPLPLAARFEGNSDPFQCYAIEITPELNRVLAFTRDVSPSFRICSSVARSSAVRFQILHG
jgi:hypothetical protein